jgi:S1-C subfamily serine protease
VLSTDLKAACIIVRVHPDSPAERADVKPGDTIIAEYSRPVKTIGDMRSLPTTKIGESVNYTIKRNDKVFSVDLVAVPVNSLK